MGGDSVRIKIGCKHLLLKAGGASQERKHNGFHAKSFAGGLPIGSHVDRIIGQRKNPLAEFFVFQWHENNGSKGTDRLAGGGLKSDGGLNRETVASEEAVSKASTKEENPSSRGIKSFTKAGAKVGAVSGVVLGTSAIIALAGAARYLLSGITTGTVSITVPIHQAAFYVGLFTAAGAGIGAAIGAAIGAGAAAVSRIVKTGRSQREALKAFQPTEEDRYLF